MQKYGKKYDENMMKIKADFFDDNDRYLEQSNRLSSVYLRQPVRESCRMCGKKFDEQDTNLVSHNVTYTYCSKCHHLNGRHIETEEFCNTVYIDENYEDFYSEQDV